MYCHDVDATAAYRLAVDRLFAVNGWHELNNSFKTQFWLCDSEGAPVDRKPVAGDYVRIDLTGPGSPSGDGYDWVRIEQIEAGDGDDPYAAMTVTPSANPLSQDPAIAHFFAAGATNTFVVRRLGNCVTAEVHGRNEVPNTEGVPLLDRVRNESVALLGSVGLSKIQWKDWTRGVVSVVEMETDG